MEDCEAFCQAVCLPLWSKYFSVYLHSYTVKTMAQSVQWLATGCTVRGSNPDGGEIFRIHPDRLWGPPSLLYNEYWFFPAGIKRLGHGVHRPPPPTPEVKERVELYLCSPFGPSWPVLAWILPLPLRTKTTQIVLVPTACSLFVGVSTHSYGRCND
jgi:hypothetical protein